MRLNEHQCACSYLTPRFLPDSFSLNRIKVHQFKIGFCSNKLNVSCLLINRLKIEILFLSFLYQIISTWSDTINQVIWWNCDLIKIKKSFFFKLGIFLFKSYFIINNDLLWMKSVPNSLFWDTCELSFIIQSWSLIMG